MKRATASARVLALSLAGASLSFLLPPVSVSAAPQFLAETNGSCPTLRTQLLSEYIAAEHETSATPADAGRTDATSNADAVWQVRFGCEAEVVRIEVRRPQIGRAHV